MTRILGVVLVGGQSRRFGSDKAFATYAGRTLLAHVVEALAVQTDAVILCGPPGAALAALGLPIVADRPGRGLGPLGGLNAALHAASSRGFDAVLTAGCDTPQLPRDLAARLAAGVLPAVLADLPIIGLWPASLGNRLDQHLAETADRSMRHWVRVAGAAMLTLDAPLANINTPADLAALD